MDFPEALKPVNHKMAERCFFCWLRSALLTLCLCQTIFPLSSLLSDQFESPENLQRALVLSSRFRDSEQPYFADTFGWVNYKLGNYEDARPALERAASSSDAIALFHYHLGHLYVALKMPAEARQSFERAQQKANEENDAELINKISEQLSQL